MAQHGIENREYKRLPLLVGLQFQNFSMPLRDTESHFSHPGVFLGTELAYNAKGTVFQNATIGGYINREIGDGLFVKSQVGARPRFAKRFYGEIKAGIGYLRTFHPHPAYTYGKGAWQSVKGGKSQMTFPIDLGFGYSFIASAAELSPFLNYQINPALFYNKTLPFTIYTNFMVGLRIKLYN